MYIAVPKIYAKYDGGGEEVTVVLTILPEVARYPKVKVIKS